MSRTMDSSPLLWRAQRRWEWAGTMVQCMLGVHTLFYKCVEWGTMYVPVGRYTCVCKCTFTNICECEGQKLTLGVFVDWSLPYKLRQGLSIKHADFSSQASFGHPLPLPTKFWDYTQVTVPVQHLCGCWEQTAVFLCM